MYYNTELNFLQEFPVPTGPGWRVATAEDIERVHNPTPTAAAIAARRYEAEVGGTTVHGMHIGTDDRSKLLITGAVSKAVRDPQYTLNWKTAAGFTQIPAEQVLLIADAVADHVQACFDREAELLAALDAGTLTTAMLEQGWP